MSRDPKKPISIPKGVEFDFKEGYLTVKNKNTVMQLKIPSLVSLEIDNQKAQFSAVNDTRFSKALSGTMRALASDMVIGVTQGFEKKLILVGVGYKAQIQGTALNLTLGFSHPISYTPPEGIRIEIPSLTEIIIKGANKQLVGQVAADIRSFRPPEPYKGKGIKYSDEVILRKETKKK